METTQTATMQDLERFADSCGVVLKWWADEAIDFALTLPAYRAKRFLLNVTDERNPDCEVYRLLPSE